MTLNRYKTRLDRQARGAPVVTLNGVLSLLSTGEDECEENIEFIRWVHRARHLSSLMAIRDSTGVADVQLKREILY